MVQSRSGLMAGIDVGGTFTDLIELDELQIMLAELPSDKKQDPTVVQLRAMIDAARSINQ